MDNILGIFEGYYNNILITLSASLLPIIIGVALNFLSYTSKTATVIVRIYGCIFQSLSPVALLFIFYFCGLTMFKTPRILWSIIVFIICFLGYIPAHYVNSYSPVKNSVVNSLGLISSAFKWSMCTSLIGVRDMIKVSNELLIITFEPSVFFIPLIISFITVLIIEVAKLIAIEMMK